MATRFHIGAKDLKGDIAAYAKRFDLLEVATSSARGPAPSAATLRRWRRATPAHFEFSVVAGLTVDQLKPGAAMEAEVERMLALVSTLRARVLVLKTPTQVTPARVWRDRMASLSQRLPRDATRVVWEPSGIWEAEDAARQAHALGMVTSVDASRDEVPAGPVAYCRLRALGETRSFGPSALGRIIARIGDRQDAYVVLETDGALAECKALRRLVATAGTGEGGLGRILRPRRGLPGDTRDVHEREEE